MKEPFVFLCPEIMREDAEEIVRWLSDKEVIKYLSDSQNVSQSLTQVLDRVNLPVLTQIFSQGGRFFMIFDSHNRPVGFLRLVIKTAETEIVIVIGDRKKWGRGLGTLAVRESLRIAFFELRSKRVVARISKDNVRSSRAFRSAGFKAYSETPLMKCYVITFDEYLKRKGDAGLPRQVYITEIDYAKLKSLIKDACIKDGGEKGKALRDLEKEINSAKIVEAKELPGNVITMNSKAVIDMSGDEEEITLVYPQEADIANNKISVLSPIGVAVLGYGEGDTVEWDIPSGVAEIKIKRVLYQPEAAGDYHL